MLTSYPAKAAFSAAFTVSFQRVAPMGLFKTDLFRSFAIGFLIGAAGLALTFGFDVPAEAVAAPATTPITTQAR